MKYGRPLRLIMAIAFALVVCGIPVSQESSFPLQPTTEAQWRKYMHVHTAHESYKQFRFMHGQDDISTHTKAHQFGHALFAVFGSEAMGVCGDAISGGCLHGYLSKMIIDQGIESVSEIIALCKEGRADATFDNCEHSAGHALLYAYGYTEGNLSDALELCTKNFPDDATDTLQSNQCYHGAFMEFNQKNTEHSDAVTTRAFDESEPYAPCDTIDVRYKDTCYYRQTQLWILAAQAENDVLLYQKLGQWCTDIPDPSSLPACHIGLQSGIVAYRQISYHNQARLLCEAAFSDKKALVADCVAVAAESLDENEKLIF